MVVEGEEKDDESDCVHLDGTTVPGDRKGITDSDVARHLLKT
jgi:hypothetical protein